jgi:hypothetical protein
MPERFSRNVGSSPERAMTPDRQVVRVSSAFFDQLDAQFRAERSSEGQPSAHDFVVLELPVIVEKFATDFDSLPEAVPGVASTRTLIAPGLIVRVFAIHGTLLDDGSIELIGITIDP